MFLVLAGCEAELPSDTSEETPDPSNTVDPPNLCAAHPGETVPDGVVIPDSDHNVCQTDASLFSLDRDAFLSKAQGVPPALWRISHCTGALDDAEYDEVSVSHLTSPPDAGYNEYAVFDTTGGPVWYDTWFWALGSCDWTEKGPPGCCYGYCCGGVEPTCAIGSGTFTPLIDCVLIDEGYGSYSY